MYEHPDFADNYYIDYLLSYVRTIMMDARQGIKRKLRECLDWRYTVINC